MGKIKYLFIFHRALSGICKKNKQVPLYINATISLVSSFDQKLTIKIFSVRKKEKLTREEKKFGKIFFNIEPCQLKVYSYVSYCKLRKR